MYVFICGGHHDSDRIAVLVMVSKAESIVLCLSSCITSKEPVCPRVELILKIIIILLIIFLGFIKSKPC